MANFARENGDTTNVVSPCVLVQPKKLRCQIPGTAIGVFGGILMKHIFVAILMVLVMTTALAACGGGEETTLTGMVVSVDGTVISLMEVDIGNMGENND